MKSTKKNLRLLPILCLVLMIFSCNNDDELSPDNGTEFLSGETFNLKGNAIYDFVLVSNQDGDVLWDTVGVFIDFDVNLLLPVNDKIDVTYDIERDLYFNVNTYRDVQSGFELNKTPYFCDNDLDLFLDDPQFTTNNLL